MSSSYTIYIATASGCVSTSRILYYKSLQPIRQLDTLTDRGDNPTRASSDKDKLHVASQLVVSFSAFEVSSEIEDKLSPNFRNVITLKIDFMAKFIKLVMHNRPV